MKANYFKIGLFVIVSAAMGVAAVVFLGAGFLAQEKVLFETYIDESVSGLSIGSPVELRGVRIGQVEDIGFAAEVYDLPEESERTLGAGRFVRVVFSVLGEHLPGLSEQNGLLHQEDTPDRGLRFRLASNIVTGQAYLEGTYLDPNRFEPPGFSWEPQYPFIPSAPSELTTLKQSVDKILGKLQEIDLDSTLKSVEQLFASVDQTLADANVAEVSGEVRELLAETREKVAAVDTRAINAAVQRVLASADRAIADANVAAVSEQATGLLADARQTNQHLQGLLLPKDGKIDEANLAEILVKLNRTLGRIDKIVLTEKPEIDLIISNFRQISENLKDLTETIKKHPAGLLRSPPPERSEAFE